jgi:CBS-domain-containing membrane protein
MFPLPILNTMHLYLLTLHMVFCCAGGQVISAIVGVCVRLALDKVQWLANTVGMSLALLAMQLTQTTHPPGGATALIACSMASMAPW